MTQITPLGARRIARSRVRGGAQPSTPVCPDVDTTAADERCYDDIAVRSLALWEEVLSALGAEGAAPSWVPAPLWQEALARASTGTGEQAAEIGSYLGTVEDLTYREACARHRFGCSVRQEGACPATVNRRHDPAGFRLARPDQSVS